MHSHDVRMDESPLLSHAATSHLASAGHTTLDTSCPPSQLNMRRRRHAQRFVNALSRGAGGVVACASRGVLARYATPTSGPANRRERRRECRTGERNGCPWTPRNRRRVCQSRRRPSRRSPSAKTGRSRSLLLRQNSAQLGEGDPFHNRLALSPHLLPLSHVLTAPVRVLWNDIKRCARCLPLWDVTHPERTVIS